MDIGIFGGTFNPFHNGELTIAHCVMAQMKLDKIIFMPNGIPPHKKKDILDKQWRYVLVQAGIAGEKNFEVSRMEVDRPGVTWSIETLYELKKNYGDTVRLNFIMGEDNIKAFEVYERREEFFKLCRFLIVSRNSTSDSAIESWRKRLPGADIVKIDCPVQNISSTMIRDLIRSGQPFETFVPAGVSQMIKEKGLYK